MVAFKGFQEGLSYLRQGLGELGEASERLRYSLWLYLLSTSPTSYFPYFLLSYFPYFLFSYFLLALLSTSPTSFPLTSFSPISFFAFFSYFLLPYFLHPYFLFSLLPTSFISFFLHPLKSPSSGRREWYSMHLLGEAFWNSLEYANLNFGGSPSPNSAQG